MTPTTSSAPTVGLGLRGRPPAACPSEPAWPVPVTLPAFGLRAMAQVAERRRPARAGDHHGTVTARFAPVRAGGNRPF